MAQIHFIWFKFILYGSNSFYVGLLFGLRFILFGLKFILLGSKFILYAFKFIVHRLKDSETWWEQTSIHNQHPGFNNGTVNSLTNLIHTQKYVQTFQLNACLSDVCILYAEYVYMQNWLIEGHETLNLDRMG
jgi:hypothetical protein